MSEREPITTELRKEMRKFTYMYEIPEEYEGRLNDLCDAIDAVHARLEQENDELGKTVYNMRREFYEWKHSLDTGWIRLPVDADGEPICVGDEMERGKAHGRVIALMLSNYPKKWGGALHWGIQLEGEQAPTALDGFFRHYHKPTVEDVLREFTDAIFEWSGKSGTVAEVGMWSDVAAEYAAKLQLKEDA